MTWWREEWSVGDCPFFEYRCCESPDSADAALWYRSHQRVTVVRVGEYGKDHDGWPGSTFEERADAGQPSGYVVRFADGYEGYVTEDELLTDERGYCCDAPPLPP